MSTVEQVRQKFVSAGQEQVFAFWEQLTSEQQQKFVDQLKSINPTRCGDIFKKATSANPSAGFKHIKPLPADVVASVANTPKETLKKWFELGIELISHGKVAVVLLAGGQGTRLGSSDPKGCYDISLPSHKSLFQLQAERILRLQSLAASKSGKSVVIPWYIMTSAPTHKPTEAFFAKNNYFGLSKDNIFFFEQGVLPAFTFDGKFYLEEKDSLSLSPDGNGGIYEALKVKGVLADMAKRGIVHIHAYGVDNCLVKVGDPTFIGYCASKNAECGAKTVVKKIPTEPVGLICMNGDKFSVVEYSEIEQSMAEQRDPNGDLVFRSANIANHYYTLDFLKSIEKFEKDLEYHIAKKKIKHIDLSTAQKISPTSPNGIKLELFIFDVFPFTKNFAVLETERAEEFSPLKNAPGTNEDSPETSKRDILAQHKRFLEAAGAVVTTEVEISPLVSYQGEGLEKAKGLKFDKPMVIATLEDLNIL